MRFAVRSVAVLVLLVGPALVSHADTYQFTFTPSAGSNADSFSFELPSSPTPNIVGNGLFDIDVSVTVDGGTGGGGLIFTDAGLLEVSAPGHGELPFQGPTLFTGSDAHPTFILGEFSLSETETDLNEGGHIIVINPGGPGILDVTDLSTPSPTPEPSTLALFGTGILGLAGVARRKLS